LYMTDPTTTATCLSCTGERWKYVTRRGALFGAAVHGDEAQVWERRPCPECRGLGVVTVRSS
jgi:hypothetical protein